MSQTLALTGIGLRTPHHTEVIEKRPNVAWLEVHSENFFADGGKALHELLQIRKHYPISMHGVSLSLGSSDDLNWRYLKKLRELCHRIDPCLVSDHLSWSSINGRYLHDLLPLPYTEEALKHVVDRIQQVQNFLKRQLLIENVTSYVKFEQSTMTEWQFLKEVAIQSGCGILLDVSNIYINATNFGFNPETYLAALHPKLVHEIHLGGFTNHTIGNREVLIDSHDHAVVPAVWELYRKAIQLLGSKPTIIEWDNKLPTLDRLCLEAFKAEQIIRETYATTKLTG